jgi:hypothetical protein
MPGPTRTAKSKYNLGQREILIDLEVPSGAMCQVRRPGPMGLMRAGILDNLDILGSLVQTDHVDRVAGKAVEPDPEAARMRQAQELLKDRTKLEAADRLMNQVVCHVVVQPELSMPEVQDGDRWKWLAPEDRDAAKTYADSVDDDDKVFIFQFVVGGTADIAQFRKEREKLMAGMESQQDVPMPGQ